MPTTALPASIPDSQLGLSASEIHILRQNQQIALAHHQSSPSYAHSTASSVSRGRGHARTSASTSRAASAASSQQQAGGAGRLLLDPGSLAVLGQHFERLMGAIQNRVEQVRPFSSFLSTPAPPLTLAPYFLPSHSNSSPILPNPNIKPSLLTYPPSWKKN